MSKVHDYSQVTTNPPPRSMVHLWSRSQQREQELVQLRRDYAALQTEYNAVLTWARRMYLVIKLVARIYHWSEVQKAVDDAPDAVKRKAEGQASDSSQNAQEGQI